jgi:hypothetical protein
MSPEQNYGMVAWELPPPQFEKWEETKGKGRVASLEADANAEFFFLRLKLASPLADGERMVIGFDTYADDRGESVLPDGVKTAHRNEFGLDIVGSTSAQMYVTEAYSLFKIWNNKPTPEQLFHSIATDGKPWVPIQWYNNDRRTWRDGTIRPGTVWEAGKLRIRPASAPATTLDAVVIDGATIDVRIPWMLLQFTDPSQLRVMDDDRQTPDVRETAVSEGIGVDVSLAGELVETKRLSWEPWDEVPATVERPKASLPAIWAAMRGLEPLP